MLNANDRSVVPIANLKEFFKDSLHETLAAQKLTIDAHTAHYIVNLLVLFARSDALFERTSEGMRVKPLVVMLSEALEARSAEERRRGLQRLGDVSLFIAGFFSRSFARKLVDIEYHIAMGGRAYAALASSVSRTRLDALTNVYAELADKFQPIVDVLNELSESGTPHSNADVLRLYEIWLKTGSKRSYGLLQRLGVTPAPGMRLASAH